MGNQQAGGHDFMATKIADTSEVLTLTESAVLSPEQTVVDVAVPAAKAVVVTLPNVAMARGRKYLVVCRSIGAGGSMTIVSGGGDLSALPTTTLIATQYAVFENVGGLLWERKAVGQEPAFKAGKYVAVTADDTAGKTDIVTGLNTIVTAQVMVLRGNNVMPSAKVTFATGVLTVADNAATYVVTAGDIIHWLVTGT